MNAGCADAADQGHRRLLLNSASGTGLFFLNIAIVFVISPVIVRQLGNRDYGIWDLLLSFCGYLGLLEVGVGPAIIRFVSRSAALGDESDARRTLVTSAAALLFAGAVSLLIMLAVSLNPYRIFNVPPRESPWLATLCVLAGFNLLVQFSGTASVAYLMGLQEHYRINTLRLFQAPVSGAAIYFALTRWPGKGLLWLSSLLLAGNLVQYGVFTCWIARRLGFAALSPRFFSFGRLRELVQFGINSSLLMLSDRIQRQSVPFVIGHMIGVASIVFYSIPARLAEYGMGLIMAIGFPLTPAFSALEARDGMKGMRQAWLDASRWMQVVIMAIAIGLGIMGRDFIAIWMGPQYADRGRWIVVLLASAMFIGGLAPNSGRLLVALGRHGQVAWKLVLVSTIAVLAAIMAGVKLGLAGVALAVAAGNVASFLLCWHKACQYLELPMMRHLRMTAKSMGPPAAALALVLFVARSLAKPAGYASLAGQAAIGCAIYLAAVWIFTLESSERQAIAGRLKGFGRRLANRPAQQQIL